MTPLCQGRRAADYNRRVRQSDDPRLLRALLSHRVLLLSNTLALAASRYYPRRFGVRLSEWRVIDALHAGPGISANQISQWLSTDKAWVGRSVERLIAAGYVQRWPDPEHGRRMLLRLTAKGERAHADIAVAAVLRFTIEAHPGLVSLADFPTLNTHAARLEALPVFQKVMQPFNPPA